MLKESLQRYRILILNSLTNDAGRFEHARFAYTNKTQREIHDDRCYIMLSNICDPFTKKLELLYDQTYCRKESKLIQISGFNEQEHLRKPPIWTRPGKEPPIPLDNFTNHNFEINMILMKRWKFMKTIAINETLNTWYNDTGIASEPTHFQSHQDMYC